MFHNQMGVTLLAIDTLILTGKYAMNERDFRQNRYCNIMMFASPYLDAPFDHCSSIANNYKIGITKRMILEG